MEYRREWRLDVDAESAIVRASGVLFALGYRLERGADRSVTATHPGHLAWRGAGRALLGASPIRIRAHMRRLSIEADFDGIRRVRRFLIQLLGGLALGLGFALGLSFGLVFEVSWAAYLGAGLGFGVPGLQLPIHLLLTVRILTLRARRDLDDLGEHVSTWSRNGWTRSA